MDGGGGGGGSTIIYPSGGIIISLKLDNIIIPELWPSIIFKLWELFLHE